MFWDLLHFYPPLGDYGFILFIFLVALPAYFVGRLLGRKIIIKKILTVVFVVAVFVMDIVYHYRIESYLGYFSNLILIPVAAGFVISWVKFPVRTKKV